jgi:hypothetical protein
MEEKTIKTIIDHVGRLVIGVEVVESSNESVLTLNNPVVIHVQPGQNNQLQVQSFPYVFMEFIAAESRDKNNWSFRRCNIVESDIQLDERIIMQYSGINSPVPAAPQGEPEVIKLFED